MKKIIWPLLFFICFAAPLHAKKTEELIHMETEELFELSLEELLDREISSAGKIAEKVSEIPASVHIVTREDIEKYGYRTVAEVIRNIPGFYTIYDYEEDTIGVRGIMNEINMIVLINGVVQHESEINEIMIPAESVDRIEVVKGPMSVIYGSGAFLGSVNIVTNHIPYGAPLSMVSASYGSSDTYKTFARKSGEKGDFAYTFNASLYGTDGIEESYRQIMSAEQYERIHPDAHKSTDGELERKNENLNFSGRFKGFYADFQYNNNKNGIFAGEPAFNDGSVRNIETTTAGAGYQCQLTETFQADWKLIYSHQDIYERDDTFPPDRYGNGAAFSYDGKEQRVETELDIIWKPLSDLNMIFGISYKKMFDTSYDGSVPASSISEPVLREGNIKHGYFKGTYDISDRDTHATFLQMNYRPFECLKLTAGARLEQYMKFKTDVRFEYGNEEIISRNSKYNEDEKIYFIPRIAAVYSLSDHHIFKLMYGEANKPFSPTDADLADIEIESEKDLEPEEIQTVELNYLLSYADFSFSLSLFRNNIRNLWTFSLQETEDEEGEPEFVGVMDNSGRMETYGTEVVLTARPMKNLDMELSATYQDTEDRTVNNRDILFSPHLLMKARLSYRWEAFTFGMNGLYVDEMNGEKKYKAVHNGEQTDFVEDRSAENKSDDYFIFDMNLRYNHEKTGLFAALKISNIFDREVRYPSDDVANGLLDEGRSFLATIGWQF